MSNPPTGPAVERLDNTVIHEHQCPDCSIWYGCFPRGCPSTNRTLICLNCAHPSPPLTYGEVYGPGGEADDSGYGQDW